jgi:hypothetical protein
MTIFQSVLPDAINATSSLWIRRHCSVLIVFGTVCRKVYTNYLIFKKNNVTVVFHCWGPSSNQVKSSIFIRHAGCKDKWRVIDRPVQTDVEQTPSILPKMSAIPKPNRTEPNQTRCILGFGEKCQRFSGLVLFDNPPLCDRECRRNCTCL